MESSRKIELDRQYKVAAFFSGVGGIEQGFEQTGYFKTVYANEYDKFAQLTYTLNYPSIYLDKRDIHDVLASDVVDSEGEEDIDVIVGGFPCQAFSIAGYRKGFDDDRGNLFFELLRMIESKKPKGIFIENVKNMVSHDKGNTFKIIREALTKNGYYIKWKVLNSKDYGNIPQNRERIYIVGFDNKEAYDTFEFPEKIELTKSLRDVIDFSNKKKEIYYYSHEKQHFYKALEDTIVNQDTVYQWRRQYVRENKNGVIPTLTANMGMGGHNVPLILTDDGSIRKLTPKETFNAQGYPESFILPENISNSQLYKQAGNSVVVPVIKRIAKNMLKALNSSDSKIENKNNKKYALIYTKMRGQFEGESYVKYSGDSFEEVESQVMKYGDNLQVLTDEEYLNQVKKKTQIEFYSIV